MIKKGDSEYVVVVSGTKDTGTGNEVCVIHCNDYCSMKPRTKEFQKVVGILSWLL